MDCKQTKEYLSEYVDAFLAEDVKTQVEAHLKTCESCKKEADALRKLQCEIRALRIDNADDFVFDKERAKAPVVFPRKSWMKQLSAVAACFVLLIGVYTAVERGYHQPENEDFVLVGSDAEPQLQADSALDIAENQNEEKKLQSDMEEVLVANEKSTGPDRTRTVEVAKSEIVVPEGVTTYSYSAFASEEMQVVEKSAETDSAIEDVGATVAPTTSEDYSATADTIEKTAPASGGGGGSSGASSNGVYGTMMQVNAKRTVQLSVSADARAAVMDYLAGARVATFERETVISEAALDGLLAIEGVTVVSDETVSDDTDLYNHNVVIIY